MPAVMDARNFRHGLPSRAGRDRHIAWRFANLTAALGLLASLCTSAAAEEIRIGLAAPMSGRAAADGLAMERALKDAIAETNAAGGLSGRPLALFVEDDGCAAATGEGAARVLAAQAVMVVIGHPCSSAATAAVPVYAAAGMLLISVGARHPAVTDANPSAPVLRLAGRDDRQGAAAAGWLKGHAKDGRVAIIHDRTRYARAIADGAVATLKAGGLEPVAVVPIVAGRRAYDEALAKIGEMRAEAVLFAGFPEEAIIVARGLAALEPAIPLLGTDSLATAEFASVAETARGGIEVLLPVEPAVRGETGRGAVVLGLRARGALEAWLSAARKLGTMDGATLAKALRGREAQTATLGAVRFDAHGDVEGAAFKATPPRGGQWLMGEGLVGER
jgi:branched-chain amino acid transport system substrate-binding protein